MATFLGDTFIKELFPNKNYTREKFTDQLSDHFPLWVQIDTDIDDELRCLGLRGPDESCHYKRESPLQVAKLGRFGVFGGNLLLDPWKKADL